MGWGAAAAGALPLKTLSIFKMTATNLEHELKLNHERHCRMIFTGKINPLSSLESFQFPLGVRLPCDKLDGKRLEAVTYSAYGSTW
jgi:hypothetical protein